MVNLEGSIQWAGAILKGTKAVCLIQSHNVRISKNTSAGGFYSDTKKGEIFGRWRF
jgi:hypothetical protein